MIFTPTVLLLTEKTKQIKMYCFSVHTVDNKWNQFIVACFKSGKTQLLLQKT